uniref:Uncharacterized protein n=1 Tax=Anguilla anguilla TaxID=7936 RepID=A0A0E9RWD5_ANGAN
MAEVVLWHSIYELQYIWMVWTFYFHKNVPFANLHNCFHSVYSQVKRPFQISGII